MKKFFGISVLFFLYGCASTPVFEEEKAQQAVINSDTMMVSIDNNPFIGFYSSTVSPGRHIIDLRIKKVACNTLAGHRYVVSASGCYDNGLTEAAQIVQKRRDAEQELRDARKYQEYKQALSFPQNEAYLQQMKGDIESKRGGFKNDHDNLLPIINQQLAPYLEAEQKRVEVQRKIKDAEMVEVARLSVIKDKEIARQRAIYEKEQAAKDLAERQRIAIFRESIKVGDETNCGPVVEAKTNLIKVAFAVIHYGTEHWVRREVLFPPSYGCQFINGMYQPPE